MIFAGPHVMQPHLRRIHEAAIDDRPQIGDFSVLLLADRGDFLFRRTRRPATKQVKTIESAGNLESLTLQRRPPRTGPLFQPRSG